ncbi:hypothetical protein ABIB50_005105 [Mucilaginibacter sp. UYCu711]
MLCGYKKQHRINLDLTLVYIALRTAHAQKFDKCNKFVINLFNNFIYEIQLFYKSLFYSPSRLHIVGQVPTMHQIPGAWRNNQTATAT